MKKHYLLYLLLFTYVGVNAQTPFQRVYNVLNTKCQNSTCHSATSSEALKFDGTETAVYSSIFNVSSANPSSIAKHEKLVKPQHPYYSFLLRKVAGESFDTDLAIDTATEGQLMLDTSGQPLSKKEIEFIRQWIMFGAKKTYSGSDAQPNWQLVSDYYDNPSIAFLPKPAKPAAGTGIQLRMGPVFLPTSGSVEQEWMELQEVNFPYPAAITKIDGFMNQQSHHFLLFKFDDTTSANAKNADRNYNMDLISVANLNTSFDGNKQLTAAWQDDAEMQLPAGTAIYWDQKTVLDMNYHVKNYSATSVLPCDFYFNIYYQQRTPSLIEMKAHLVNNAALFIPQGVHTLDYDDPDNNMSTKEVRYLWNLTSHAHKYGTDYDLYIRDTSGTISTQIYEGFYDYTNNVNIGHYTWDHPSIEYWPSLYPVHFGKHNGHKSGIVARTTWDVQQSFVTFGFTTNDEMQLFYYMYTTQDPAAVSAINDDEQKAISFQVIPNPMSSTGKLVYVLDNASTVEASVIDVTGKTVTQLSKENQTEGVHTITLDSNLSAGIYFARLNINGTVYTRKFVVN